LVIMRRCGVNRGGYSFIRRSIAYKVFIRPVIEYGLAASFLNITQLNKLEKFQNRMLRFVLGATNVTSVDVLRKLAEVEAMECRVTILQASWLRRFFEADDQCMLGTLKNEMNSRGAVVHKMLMGNKLVQSVLNIKEVKIESVKESYIKEFNDKRLEELLSTGQGIMVNDIPKTKRSPL
jgi:hypothetical protein